MNTPMNSEASQGQTHHDTLPVAGYTPQPQYKIDLVNENKRLEETILRQLDRMGGRRFDNNLEPAADPRWLAIARTYIEQGFMALNRSIFKPTRIPLPGDTQNDD